MTSIPTLFATAVAGLAVITPALHADTVRRMIRRGELGCLRRPGLVLILPRHIEEWEAAHECHAIQKDLDCPDGLADESGTSATVTIGSVRVARIKARLFKS